MAAKIKLVPKKKKETIKFYLAFDKAHSYDWEAPEVYVGNSAHDARTKARGEGLEDAEIHILEIMYVPIEYKEVVIKTQKIECK